MDNFYKDNDDMRFHLQEMDLKEIIEMKEDRFADFEKYADAPENAEEALENYGEILELVGEIAGEYLFPMAADVDTRGAVYENGTVIYARGTEESIDRLKKANLMGFTTPRKYGGLNLPKIIYSMAIELISMADASFMTIFGLQEIAETINHFGSDEQRDRYLPLFSKGEVLGAMALTEPDAGSDLPSVKMKASQDEKGNWFLNGVKRFITNGCAQVLLVMARSEEDIDDARGLSLFIYRRDENMKIRRIEDKFGIHGSPTCELQFDNAPAELLGVRKRGLIKYTMSLMNGARLGVSAQAVGIAEAAYREARSYASKRIQFSQKIDSFPPVYEMLTDMKVNIEASRSLLYEASQIVDLKEGLDKKILLHPELKFELKNRLRKFDNLESLFTPMLKCYVTEMGNRICYDALQVHGGVGYTRDFIIERLCRDMRITSIYEGTTQLQVVAAIGALLKGFASERIEDYESMYDFSSIPDLFSPVREFKVKLEKSLEYIKGCDDQRLRDYHARRLVEMGADTIISYLLLISAIGSMRKKTVARIFISKAEYRINHSMNYILSGDKSLIDGFEDVIKTS
ncbi:MAG: acyl-CoA dehydrogenase family protein [Spirochaetaceae bacterium]|nr:acyl-CoA dehydrogenase family protein [Spirochaetaceae bacterium]